MPTTMPRSVLAALAAGLVAAGAAVAQQPAVKRIIPGGADGERSYYVVSCRDDTRTSIIVDHASEEICATPRGGTAQCRKDWRLRDAADHACKGGGRG